MFLTFFRLFKFVSVGFFSLFSVLMAQWGLMVGSAGIVAGGLGKGRSIAYGMSPFSRPPLLLYPLSFLPSHLSLVISCHVGPHPEASSFEMVEMMKNTILWLAHVDRRTLTRASLT